MNDLVLNNSETAMDGFNQALAEINNEDFKLKNNYVSLNIGDYISFNIVTYNGEFVAMAGLQKSSIDSNFARASTRLYISKKYRNQSVSKNRLVQGNLPEEVLFPNSKLIFPYQVNIARKNNFKALYITREEPFQLRMIQSVLNAHNDMQASENRLTLLSKIYNIAKPAIEKKSCYQRFMVLMLDKNYSLQDFEKKLTSISDEDLKSMVDTI